MAIKVIKRLRYIRLSPDVIASLPVTDIRHILVEIDTYRHVLQMMEQIAFRRAGKFCQLAPIGDAEGKQPFGRRPHGITRSA